MQVCRITTPWVAASGASPDHPLLADAFALASWQDVTGQAATSIPPTPNTFTVETRVSEAVLTTIQADARFAVLSAVAEVVGP